MNITEEEYEAALKRIDELLPLVTEATPDDDYNLIELLKVSDIVGEYEDEHYPISEPITSETTEDPYQKNSGPLGLSEIL